MIFFMNKGNEISTVLFLQQALGQKINRKPEREIKKKLPRKGDGLTVLQVCRVASPTSRPCSPWTWRVPAREAWVWVSRDPWRPRWTAVTTVTAPARWSTTPPSLATMTSPSTLPTNPSLVSVAEAFLLLNYAGNFLRHFSVVCFASMELDSAEVLEIGEGEGAR